MAGENRAIHVERARTGGRVVSDRHMPPCTVSKGSADGSRDVIIFTLPEDMLEFVVAAADKAVPVWPGFPAPRDKRETRGGGLDPKRDGESRIPARQANRRLGLQASGAVERGAAAGDAAV